MQPRGKVFGLVGSASQRKRGQGKQRAAVPVASAFGGGTADGANSGGEEEAQDPTSRAAVNRRLAEESKRRDLQLQLAQQADPSLYDYDGAYDGMKQEQQQKSSSSAASKAAAAAAADRKPRYIENLLKQAKMREVEQDRVYERKLQREREAQDAEMGQAELKFITSAYKKKLMEQKKWQHQRELEDEREAKQDVTKSGMGGFYANLLTKNIAMGGDVEHATSAFTAGSKRNAATMDYKMQQEREEEEEAERRRQERERRDAQQTSAAAAAAREDEDTSHSARMVDSRLAAAPAAPNAVAESASRPPSAAATTAAPSEPAEDAAAAAKRKAEATAAAVAAARERALARKRARTDDAS